MNQLEVLNRRYHECVPLKAKREVEKVNLVDITTNGVIIGVYRERIYELCMPNAGDVVRTRISERLIISVCRVYHRNRFVKVKHFPKDQLEQVLLLANQVAQMEIQRATTAVAV